MDLLAQTLAVMVDRPTFEVSELHAEVCVDPILNIGV